MVYHIFIPIKRLESYYELPFVVTHGQDRLCHHGVDYGFGKEAEEAVSLQVVPDFW